MSYRIPIIDGHNDTLLNLHLPARGGGRSFFERSESGHLDLPRALEAGLSAGFFAIFVPNAREFDESDLIRTPKGYEIKLSEEIEHDYAYGFTRDVMAKLAQLERDSGGRFRQVADMSALKDCLDRGVLAAILHFEGAEAIDTSLNNLEQFYEDGLRSLGIVWSRPNAFACGVPFRFPSSPDTGPGLTEAGKELVRACNELGVMLDLSHLNEKGFYDVARISKAPLVATHSAAHALTPRSRNLTDAQLQTIADSNGVVGITFAGYDLCPDGGLDRDYPLSDLIRHIVYVAERIGVEHVALGSDFDGAVISQEMKDVTGLPKLISLLQASGFDEPALHKLTHENWIRILDDTW